MDPGNECTNYAAFVESTVYGIAPPSYTLGNGGSWAADARSNGVLVNRTPSVGAVAEWNGGDPHMTKYGHVGIVEKVGPNDSYIVVSQQDIVTDANGYDWTQINAGGSASKWEEWPDNFIHFGEQKTPPPTVSAFIATPSSLPATGGSVALSAQVTNATSCLFSSRPDIPGLPATIPCSTGTDGITVPANTEGKVVTNTFDLTVIGTTSVTAKPVKVTVAAEVASGTPVWSVPTPTSGIPVVTPTGGIMADACSIPHLDAIQKINASGQVVWGVPPSSPLQPPCSLPTATDSDGNT